ncbi:hypothetical protein METBISCDRAFT_26188 [Metschnikowia bicuspidata]|uniref:Uncharacterized protein n=1 Tax=Metschnikowia bicuspidata TaxID=27322 RepID=A0A4P9ZG14_9ASCO|nr:hypothetical protein METBISCDRAFT_26188 [Metschnikowia bicuspidata]
MLLVVLLLLCVYAWAIPINQKPILKLSVKTHERALITSMLLDAYSEAYSLNSEAFTNYITNFNSLALQYTANEYCVESSAIRYYIKSFSIDHKDYAASQCALNLNSHFSSIILPEHDFHTVVHGIADPLTEELDAKIRLYILDLPNFDFDFEQFGDLNYGLECYSGYSELMQVMYKEKVLTVNLQVLVTVPDQCTFSALNPEFDTTYDKITHTIQIPMSGEFYCQTGPSVTCTMSMANTRNSRYQLFE